MAHSIEMSKSARAKCRTCREPVPKDVLRFGEEVLDTFGSGGTTHVWHHMACAAKKKPAQLKEALAEYTGDIPDRAALEKTISESIKTQKPSVFPYAEHAPSGRAKCIQCQETIEKGDLRIAIEREVDTGAFTTKGAGYLHIACAVENTGDDTLLEKVKTNTHNLTPEDLASLEAAMA